MATVIEGEAGGPIREIRMEAGERSNSAKYDEMNLAFQNKTIEELQRLAGADEPFFLQYWPMVPLDNTRAGRDGPDSPNGGLYVDKMQMLDGWLGDIFAEMETLGVADNTIVDCDGRQRSLHQVFAAVRLHPESTEAVKVTRQKVAFVSMLSFVGLASLIQIRW